MIHIRIGTRSSELALWQTTHIRHSLGALWPDLTTELVTIETRGDQELERPLPEIGGKGLFTVELEEALRGGSIDLAVHSLKDLPVEEPDGITIAVVPRREAALDALVSRRNEGWRDLPGGAVVGTSSLRRQGQLLAVRPDVLVRALRGNLPTRLKKLEAGEYDAVLLAQAGLVRLGLEGRISQILPEDLMLPAPGQGALAVQCRRDDRQVLELLRPLEHASSRAEVNAERSFLQALGGGCSLPVGALASARNGEIHLQGVVVSVDGGRQIRVQGRGSDPVALGAALGEQALGQGARELLHA